MTAPPSAGQAAASRESMRWLRGVARTFKVACHDCNGIGFQVVCDEPPSSVLCGCMEMRERLLCVARVLPEDCR